LADPEGVNLDPQTSRRLVHVKAVYNQGLRLAESGGEIEGGLAVVAFDNSLEMVMYTCLEYLGAKIPDRALYADLVSLALETLKEKGKDSADILNPSAMKSLHRARNSVQHWGNLPSRNDVERFRSTTETILQSMCKEVFSIDLGEVSLAQLIKNPAVKKEYLKADNAYSAGRYLDSMIFCACAFEYAVRLEQGRLFGSWISIARPRINSTEGNKLLEYVDKLEEEIEILKLRLDYKAYQVFRESLYYNVGVSQPLESISGLDKMETELRRKIGSSIDPSRTDLRQKARFCLDFVVDAILRWESVERASWFDLLIQMSRLR
jgi:hypothetical protein